MAMAADSTRFELQRDRMLRAAAACFNQKGYSGTSLKDVARQLGLTDAALYYYVKNKEELVYQCYLRAAELGREAMEAARESGGSGLEQAGNYIRNHVATIVGDAGPVAIMSEIPSLKTAHRNDILSISRRRATSTRNTPSVTCTSPARAFPRTGRRRWPGTDWRPNAANRHW
ncbi:MAG: TetR/AcrR family transcriptional regulator, partial [Woeseiaceae bacterium]